MPLSGNCMGSNVWVEDNDLLLYLSTPGARDEIGALLKLGRVRIETEPCIFEGATFEQKLHLADGAIYITTVSPKLGTSTIKLWSEVTSPIVHIELESESEIEWQASYESWREKPLSLPEHRVGKRFLPHYERGIAYSNIVGADWDVQILNDNFRADNDQMLFYHRMREKDNLWERQMDQQDLRPIEDQLFDPVTNLTFGGKMVGDGFVYSGKSHGHYVMNDFVAYKYKTPKMKSTELTIVAHVNQTPTLKEWEQQLDAKTAASKSNKELWAQNERWWDEYWSRSHIIINSGKDESDAGWMVGRNYNLFRYMLASGLGAKEPLMFNGGLFTFDPKFEGEAMYGPGGLAGGTDWQYDDHEQRLSTYTPDFRRWGAAFTAQNQRLVYFPMMRSGDYDLLEVIFDWYLDLLPNAQAITRYYNNIDGCMFNEQINMTGITGMSEYGWNNDFTKDSNKYRPDDCERGITSNGIARIFISQLEFSWVMLDYVKFSGKDVSKYLEFIEQSVIFYDEYYRKWERSRTGKELLNGKLHLYPANALEGNAGAENPNCAIFGLEAVIKGLLELDDTLVSPEKKARFRSILATLPDHPIGIKNGKEYYKIAENKDIKRHKLVHAPQLYALYPFKQGGIGDNLEIYENTIEVMNDIDPEYSKSTGGWNHNLVKYALIGNTEVARKLLIDKVEDGPFRFPAFINGDYGPDHNAGGVGAICLQEMILQSRNNEIRVLPAWPDDWSVDFKLHAPYEVVEGEFKDGKMVSLHTTQNSPKTKIINHKK